RHLVEIDFHGIERKGVAGLVQLEINGLVAFIAIVREIDVDGKPVMIGRGAARQALRKGRTTGKQTGCQHEQNSFHITSHSQERLKMPQMPRKEIRMDPDCSSVTVMKC